MLFSLQHELAQAADEGVRQLIEQTDGDVSATEKAAAMKVAATKKAEVLHKKMSKLVCVANPELTDAWLQEVCQNRKCLILFIHSIHLFPSYQYFVHWLIDCASLYSQLNFTGAQPGEIAVDCYCKSITRL